jgi:FkbM family methyltransferase
MNKIKVVVKVLLANTVFFSVTKSAYDWLKVKRDKHAFIKKNPESIYVHYSRAELASQREEGFTSQYGQDYFLWHQILDQKDRGIFVDIGANHPIDNSNSLYLEQAGWSGIAIDPLKLFKKCWQEKRETELICGAVASENIDMEFVEFKSKQGWEHQMSGFKELIREDDFAIHDYEESLVRAKPLHCFVSDPETVDLILIDVEGAEMQVLEGIDFSLFTPNFILIENNRIIGGSDLIKAFLFDRRYKCVARISAADDLYIRENCG